jgi:isochorismate pyruvate lyase
MSFLYVKIARATTPAYNSAAMQNDDPPKLLSQLPEDCADLAELRAAIDLLDAQLVALLARRQTYIERAAVLKQDRAAVRDEARIEDVIIKVVATAKAAGLSPEIAEPVWRLLIERSIAHELEAFDTKR